MKTGAMIIAMLLISLEAQAQELNYVMHHGDVLVYEDEVSAEVSIVEFYGASYWRKTAIGDPVDTVHINRLQSGRFMYFVDNSSGDALDPRLQIVDESGVVSQSRPGDRKDMELFPTSRPASDTILLINDRWNPGSYYEEPYTDTAYNFRMFDTLVCGADVRAMAFTRRGHGTLSEVVASDIFGIVSVHGPDGHWRLISAVIGGKDYARDPRKFAAFPACADSKFYYETEYSKYPQATESVFNVYELRETRVNGVNYFLPGAMLWNVPPRAAFRVDRGVVYMPEGGGEATLDSTASLGTRTEYGIVVDTGVLLFAGEQYRFMQTQMEGRYYTWLEGLGLWKVATGYWSGGSTTMLRYAVICGVEYGTRVDIPETPLSIRLFEAPYPNPVPPKYGTLYFRAKYPLFGAFSFSLFDALGREVHRSTEDAPMFVGIPIAALAPGLYYLYITGNQIRETYKIMIQ